MKDSFFFQIFYYLVRALFWLRYRVTVKGLENLNPQTLTKPGGILFLPNHPAVFVDPTLVTIGIWRKFPVRPMMVDTIYYQPIIYRVMKLLNALPIPDFETSSNSLKRKKGEEIIQTVIQDLKKGDNFLIYPSGRTKMDNFEVIGAASAAHRIVQEAPEANIVLVRTKGLWGSSFSRVLTGKSPPLFSTLFQNVKRLLKNGIFFMPRRDVSIEFMPAPADFPYVSSRLEMNRWLENWYNRPDGLSAQTGEYPGETLKFVSYSFWRKEIPQLTERKISSDGPIQLDKIPEATKEKILQEISRITQIDKTKIQPHLSLDRDLGMDSLDVADLSFFIQEQFGILSISAAKMNTVAKAFAVANKQIDCREENEEGPAIDLKKWTLPIPQKRVTIAPGKLVPEVFLNTCARMGKRVACADERAGVMTYRDIKLRVILLAEMIRTFPGEQIGVLLPSSVAAYLIIIACQLAGKVPVLVNWTMGSRHLQAVRTLSKVQVVLTSKTFTDRLQNVDLHGIEDILVMLEEVRNKITFTAKLRAFAKSLRGTRYILKSFGIAHFEENRNAVILFTSGTENLPKGVPLTHKNILSNLQQAFKSVVVYSDDVMFGILPPFHAFGFTISGLLALLSGIRVIYSPDPTDGKELARMLKVWGGTLMCGAPTFLKAMFRGGKKGDFDSLRLCVTGAEKAPPELFQLAQEMGIAHAIYEGYGITECSPVLTINLPGKEQMGVGEPLIGIELKIVNPETFEPQEATVRGLVLAKGTNIFSGYINPDISSPFVTVDGQQWYNTGDLGYLDNKNRLILCGRQKRFVKIGGEMVSLSAVEDALLEIAQKKGWPIAEEGPTLAICAKEGSEKTQMILFAIFDKTSEEVNAALREAGFSSLVKVSTVYHLEDIPIMGSGKIFYRQLESAYLA